MEPTNSEAITTTSEGQEPEILHLYAQGQNHDDAFVIGNRAGLIALRQAIDAALANRAAKCHAFVADGEGFAVFVACVSEPEIEALQYPYTEKVDSAGVTNTWLVGGERHPSSLFVPCAD